MTQSQALAILKTGANAYLTGEPGSGKTYTINAYVSYLRSHGIEPAITASTGIAATHIHGQTIHSWSGIGIKRSLSPYDIEKIASTEYISKRIQKTKVLIIDEISMIDAGTIDMVDSVCREVKQNDEPFGGMQVVLVGDFFQLPPISRDNQNHFAFKSNVWQKMKPIVCYITEQHRQSDDNYLEVLGAIRNNTYDQMHHEHIEKRLIDKKNTNNHTSNITRLFSHNADVDTINQIELNKIEGIPSRYTMTSKGKDSMVAALKKGCLSPEVLELKIGAIVMCTKNNKDKGYVNGTLGTVVGFESGTYYPIIKTKQGEKIVIEQTDWNIEENGKIKASITQIPLRLAWAITIHKSQGLSLDESIMDLSEVFEYGQGYVALSRVRTLNGLHLLGFNSKAFEVHPQILESDVSFRKQSNTAEVLFGDMPKEKLKKMQDNFILASGGVLDTVKKVKDKISLSDTLEATKVLILQGLKLVDIAKDRGLTISTIVAHIEKLIENKTIESADIEYLIEPKTFANLKDIKKTFQNLDTSKIAPVFKHYHGKFSYEQIRLARLVS